MVVNIFYYGATALVGQRPPHYRGFTHSDTTHIVGLLWTSDQPGAETSTWQYTTLTTDRHTFLTGGIRKHNVSKWAAADPHLRPRGHWDRQCCKIPILIDTGSQESELSVFSTVPAARYEFRGNCVKWNHTTLVPLTFTSLYCLVIFLS
jgi:hypothetical protein